MAVKIIHALRDERGKLKGGKKEIRLEKKFSSRTGIYIQRHGVL